jgi:hypothetical protein
MTTKTKAIIAAAVGGVALLALLGGGPPSELEVKGLRLGMSVEEAGRVMLGHGFEIGGKADPGYNTWAIKEHTAAAAKHAAEYIRKVCAERGFTDFGSYVTYAAAECGAGPGAVEARLFQLLSEKEHELYAQEVTRRMARFIRAESERLGARTLAEYIEKTANPEEYRANEGYIRQNYGYRIAVADELERGVLLWFNEGSEYADVPLLPDGEGLPKILDVLAEQAPDGTLSLANLEQLLDRLGGSYGLYPPILDPDNISEEQRLGIIELLPEAQRFPDLDAYIAERYPEGRPYHLGGPWDGKAELKLEGGRLAGEGWNLFVDDRRTVERIELWPQALSKLFGAGDMTAEEFAASFASAYGVPLEPTARVMGTDMAAITGDLLDTGWAYLDREAGWAVKLSEHKVLELRAVTPASKQSFD